MDHADEPLVDEILSVLKDRDILEKRDFIASALGDPATGPQSVEWVSKHLRPDYLLSREELTLYNKLESTGSLSPILRDPDFNATRPFLEDDIRTAIQTLEASTVAIQKQSDTLSQQCETLKKQFRRQESVDQDRARDIARLRKKHEAGRQNTAIAANELSDELEASFRGATEKAGAENKRILSALSVQLRQDDKALGHMESLMSGIKSSNNNASTVKRTADLSSVLADYVAEEIHYRLDRLYLEAIEAGKSSSYQAAVESETIAALEEELGSLFPEIEVLAEMSTRQEYQEPILREIQNEHGQLRVTSHQNMEKVLDTMVDMTLSKQELTKQLVEWGSTSELLEQLASLYQAETATPLVPQPSARRESLRRRSLQPGMVLSAARNSASMPDQPALENLLRRIGVSSESVLRPWQEGGGAQGLHEKRIQMAETLRDLGAAVDSPLVGQLAVSDHAAQLLESSLHANSSFETSLPDPGQRKALSDLEGELASLQKGVQGINLEVLHQRDRCQARLLERWGRNRA